MASERTKPLTDAVALAGELSERGSDVDDLPKRIERYGKAKHRTKQNIQYLSGSVEHIDPETGEYFYGDTGRLQRRLEDCGNWLVFRNYYTVGETRLTKARFCMKHLLCPLCAIRRGAKSLAAYLDRFNEIIAQNPRLVPYLLTLTVANGEDLQERFDHLVASWKSYQQRRRDWLKKGRGFNELCKVEGAVFSYEFTYSEKGWHPHIHAIVLLDPDQLIDFDFKASGLKKSQSRLSQEWLSITGDSSIVDCRPIDTQDPAKSFAEVFKYALKFSDLPPKENFLAYTILKGKRLQGSFGLFWGVSVPDKLTDDLLPDELPYIELFYKYTNAGYTVTHHHHHTGGERPEVRIISPLDERSDNALAKAEKYRSNAWWLVEKRQREAQ